MTKKENKTLIQEILKEIFKEWQEEKEILSPERFRVEVAVKKAINLALTKQRDNFEKLLEKEEKGFIEDKKFCEGANAHKIKTIFRSLNIKLKEKVVG